MSIRTRVALFSAVLFLGATGPASAAEDYAKNVGNKFGSGISNIALCWVEIPKNMINTYNQTTLGMTDTYGAAGGNPGIGSSVLAVTGGTLKGILHMGGRIITGVLDLITFPLPTQPIAKPAYVWQDFDSETRYGQILQKQP